MLQPTNRLTLIDAMRPPPGHVFDAAMAVTFTLDLQALLAAPAALALTPSTGMDAPEPQAEPIELLHGIRAHAASITVFSQAGEIALPPSRRVFAFLERSVVPVTAPRGGVVHPKVWVLRYIDPDAAGPPWLRVLASSRNLTFDTSWDTLVRLDSSQRASGVTLEPIAGLFDAMIRHAIGAVHEVHHDRVRSLGDDLRRLTFAPPPGVDDVRVHVLGLGDTPAPLPLDAERSLIISPFVSDDFFTGIHPAPLDEVVSRAEQLDGLRPAVIDRIGTPYVFDDGSTPEFDAASDQLAPLDPARPIQGLHAKVFAYEAGGRAHVFCGSANATGAAFGSNVELLVELIGSPEQLGIDRLSGGSDDGPALRSLFQPYRRHPDELEDDDSKGSLDAARRAIGRLHIAAHVEPSGHDWAVTYRSTECLPALTDLEVACWPLPSRGSQRSVSGGIPLHVRFEVSLQNISGFLAFDVTDRGDGDDVTFTRFVVPVTLQDVPEHRDGHLLRLLIGNSERFLRYLMALLAEASDDLGVVEALEQATSDTPATGSPRESVGLPVLEHLVRTLRRDPARLTAIDPLVTDLAADRALPPGFDQLWNRVRAIAVDEDHQR